MDTIFFQPTKENWERSIRENRPIVFIFQDKLCTHCRSFASSMLSNPEVQQVLFSAFIPIFLDVYAYPELVDRYSEMLEPKHPIHSLNGGFLGKCSSSSPKQFLRNLRELKRLQPQVQDHFQDLYGSHSFRTVILDNYQKFHEKLDLIAEISLSSILRRYDRIFGGWNLAVSPLKFHPSATLEFLLLLFHRSRDEQLLRIIIHTLNASIKGLQDSKVGGFYEFCLNRDWTEVGSYQKTIKNNAAIAMNLFHTYQITDDRKFLTVLQTTLDFIAKNLWDDSKSLFQTALLTHTGEKLINELTLTDNNCDTICLYLEVKEILEEILGKQYYFRKAIKALNVLNKIVSEFGLPHLLLDGIDYQFLLRDQVAYLNLLIKAYSFIGKNSYLQRAEQQLDIIMKYYFDRKIEIFKDRTAFENRDFGPLRKVLYPIRENARMVENLVTLSYLTSNPTYREIATRCVTSYYSNFGISRDAPYPPEFVIANQRLVESPIELLIIGAKEDLVAQRMLLEMKKIYEPFKIIQQLDPNADRELISKKIPSRNHFQQSTAFVKIENTISPPAFYPKEISKLLHTLLEAIKYDVRSD